jgi:outer membrane receptor protein involved in Fe transport
MSNTLIGRARRFVPTGVMLAAAVTAVILTPTALADTTSAGPEATPAAPDAPAEAPTLDVITVTGTHIKRADVASASPLMVVGSDEIKYEGATSVENVLNRMPQFTADSNENGSNGSDGTARVNLRDLGPARSLVLIDGQRMLPVETADVNFIPTALVERVDVVTGGASAVYGSDAVAGVVNFILRKNLQGVRFDANYGIAQQNNDNGYLRSVIAKKGFAEAPSSTWDGGRADFNLAFGSNSADDKGNATFYLGYRELQPVTQDRRDYSACALNLAGANNDAFSCGGSSNNPWGLFSMLGGPNQGSTFNNTKDGQKVWVPYDNSFLYNYAPTNYIQRSDSRITGGAFAHYDYNPAASLYGSFMYMDDHTFSQAAPSAYFQGNAYSINCDNPLMSAQQASILCGAAAGTATSVNTFIGYRFPSSIPRRDDLRHTDYRLNLGSRGALGDAWSYDASFLYSTIIFDESYKNNIDLTKATRGLQVVNVAGVPTCKSVVDGSDPNCVPVDVFGYNAISPAAFKYIITPTYTHGVQQERVFSGVVNGDLTRYGMKSPFATNGLALAVGAEHRAESLTFEADAVAQQSGTQPNAGSFGVTEGYAELDVPLVSNIPLVKSLSFNTGYRYSTYDIAGGNNFKAHTYKFELQYQPIDDFKLRGSYNRAVRAPNVTELFLPQSVGNVSAQDPCAGANPSASPEACARSGVKSGQYGHILPCPTDVCDTLGGGNLTLRPEVADTVTFGFVATPEFVPGLTLSADYFDIFVDHYINAVDAQTIINQCIGGSQYFCNLFHRDPITGVLFGTNGYLFANNQNTGYLQTSGADVSGSYRFDVNELGFGRLAGRNWGQLELSLVGTWLNSRRIEQLPGLPTYNCKGLFGPTCGEPTPSWRHNVRVTWTAPGGATTVSAFWRYFGSTSLSSNTSDPSLMGDPLHPVVINAAIPAYSYLDLAATWKIHSVELRGGVNNVFDKDPPAIAAGLLASFGNGNTYPGIYDPMGRVLFVGATVAF